MPPPSKRRRVESKAVEEINFDETARFDFLTGFHKRKVERARHAQEIAQKKARAEKLEERKKLREGRKADLERQMQEANAILRANLEIDDEEENGEESGDEWNGIASPEPEPIDHEAEYIDEEKYTTVTVEAMDVTREGLFNAAELQNKSEEKDTEDQPNGVKKDGKDEKSKDNKKKWSKEKPKKKRKKFRYESKTERKLTRTKERLKNSKQARARRTD